MAKTYSEHEALQAVCAALAFSQMGVGRAARDQDGQELSLYHGLTCYVCDGAHDLLAKAQELIDKHGMAVGMADDLPLTARDLRRAIPDRRTPQERTRDQVYARGNRWQMENYEATH